MKNIGLSNNVSKNCNFVTLWQNNSNNNRNNYLRNSSDFLRTKNREQQSCFIEVQANKSTR